VHRFTVGQRKGLGLSAAKASYVLAVLPAERTVVVGPEEALEVPGLRVRAVNWLSIAAPHAALRAGVKIRYRAQDAGATITPLDEGRAEIRFDAPQRAVTPGQAAVFYDGDVCLGGGWIESALQ
jgi:tRNA-specific 2-thiouridylase